MKKRTTLSCYLLFIMLLTSCTPLTTTSTVNTATETGRVLTPTAGIEILPAPIHSSVPRPTGEREGNAYVDSYVIKTGSVTNSISIYIKGNLPTPCHQVRVEVRSPDVEHRIFIHVYSVVKKSGMCAEVLAPFEHRADLKDLPDGEYSLFINETKMGEFQIPYGDT